MQINLANSWTLSFLAEWKSRLSPLSLLRWRNYCKRSGQGRFIAGRRLRLRIKSPIHAVITLRESPSDEQTLHEVLVEEVYEPVVAILHDNARIIDLGANIGLASLYLAHHVHNAQVMAVEPNPETFSILKANLESLIAEGRCKTLQAAVWRKQATLILDDHGAPEQFNMYSTREESSSTGNMRRVQGWTISDLIQNSGFEIVDLLKIDIEGAEREIFQGDLSWLQRIEAIAIEFHGDSRRICEFDRIVKERNFRVYEHPHTIVAVRDRKTNTP